MCMIMSVGTSPALLVLTERLTRMGIVIRVPDHTAESVVRAMDRLYDHVLHKVGKFVVLAQLYVRAFCPEVFLIFCLRRVPPSRTARRRYGRARRLATGKWTA